MPSETLMELLPLAVVKSKTTNRWHSAFSKRYLKLLWRPQTKNTKRFPEGIESNSMISDLYRLSMKSTKDHKTPGPVFTKKLKMRIRIRIKLINSHNLLKNSLNSLKFAPLIKEVRIDILMSPNHGYVIKYLKYWGWSWF